jgi:hypothetical protein
MSVGYPFHFPGKFQRQVYPTPAPGVEGDFCDHNPRATVDAGPGGLVAGTQGVAIGRFAWLEYSLLDPNNAPRIANCYGVGLPAGFVHREQQATLANWLGGASMWIPPGYGVTLHQAGGFFVINRGTTYAQVGMKAFANTGDGSISFGAAASTSTVGGASVTGSIAASTWTGTGYLAGNVLTVATSTAGTLQPGTTVTGAGVPAGLQVTKQLSGTTGGVGTYSVNVAELAVGTPAAPIALSGTYGTMTVTAVTSGSLGVGDTITGSGAAAGTTITGLGTGTGGQGTYIVNNNTVVASTALTAGGSVETKWFATSGGAAGELIKISSWPLG